MQKSGDIATFKTYVDKGIQLKKEGKLASAIEKFSKALQLNPKCLSALNQLMGIYESKKEFDRAITYLQQVIQLQPDNGLAYARLARAMMTQKNIQGAITNYQKAITLQPDQPAWVYDGLGDTLNQNGQIDEALAHYKKVIEIKPDIPQFYIRLAKLYYKQGQFNSVIDSYQKAIKLKPDLPLQIYKSLAEALELQGRTDEAVKWLKSAPRVQEGETYLQIWNALNQTDLQILEEESSSYPTEIDRQAVEQYFTQTSKYKLLNLTSLSEEDKRFIESVGLSLT
ncbi:MAG: tetratricopeptide repeat protein [Xenococcaceae cyanobacterium MO_188.B29]|nr:tetratricopeptide repeat protein [Xenococcaceae cyanobacterium MO_188.B29]